MKKVGWQFWVLLGIITGIATGVVGDMGFHQTQTALGLATVVSAVAAFFSIL